MTKYLCLQQFIFHSALDIIPNYCLIVTVPLSVDTVIEYERMRLSSFQDALNESIDLTNESARTLLRTSDFHMSIQFTESNTVSKYGTPVPVSSWSSPL